MGSSAPITLLVHRKLSHEVNRLTKLDAITRSITTLSYVVSTTLSTCNCKIIPLYHTTLRLSRAASDVLGVVPKITSIHGAGAVDDDVAGEGDLF